MKQNQTRRSSQQVRGRRSLGASETRARIAGIMSAWVAIIASLVAIPAMLALAGSISWIRIADDFPVADCVIVADFRKPSKSTLAAPFSIDGNSIYITYVAPEKDGGTWSVSGNFTLTYNNGILDKNGKYHPLYIRFNNPKGAWSKGRATSVTKTDSKKQVKQLLIELTAHTIDVKSAASARYVGSTNVDKAGVTASSVGVVAYTNVAGLKYNLYARDIDQPNRLKGAHDYSGDYSERIAFASTQLKAATVYGEKQWTYGGNTYKGSQFIQYDSANAIIKSKANHNSSWSGNVNGAAFVAQVAFHSAYSATNGVAFRWTGSQCETRLFQDLSYAINTKAGAGGKCEQVAGTNASAAAISLTQTAISEGGFTTATNLKAVPKNNYIVRAVPNTGYHVTSLKLDGTSQGTNTSVSIKTIKADHTVTATFAPNTYKVKFDGNGTTLHPARGGTGKSESGGYYATVDGATGANGVTNLSYATTYTLNANGFTRDGYTFVNWNHAANGSSTSRANKSTYSNLTATNGGVITLFAQWNPYYHVKFDANGGTGTTENVNEGTDAGLRWDKAYTLTDNGFTRPGYRFLGWSTDKKATSPMYANKASIKATSASSTDNFLAKTDANAGKTVTLYAVWLDESHGAIEIHKQTTGDLDVSGNPAYSMSHAVYGIYSDSDCQTLVMKTSTNDEGVAAAPGLESGDYWVKEISAPSGYDLDETVHPVTIPGTETVQVVSSEPIQTGALIVEKQLIGGSQTPVTPMPDSPTPEDGWYKVSVTLTYPNNPYPEGTTSITYGSGTAQAVTFDLTRNESATTGHADIWVPTDRSIPIPGVPLGTSWSIEEDEASQAGCQVVYTNQSGTLEFADKTETVTISNIKGNRQATTVTNTRKTGSLTVSKEVTGEGIPADARFQMELRLNDPYGNAVTNDSFEDSDGSAISFDEEGVARFSLAAGESKKIVGIPSGYTYAVEEALSDDEAWHYVTKYNGGDIDSGTGDVEANEDAAVTVTNSMRTGSLIVEKDVVEVAGADRTAGNKFHIGVTLAYENGDPFSGTLDGKSFDATDGYEFDLAHGQSMRIDGIPCGFRYRVEERLTGNNALMYVPSYDAQEGTIGNISIADPDAPDDDDDEDDNQGNGAGDIQGGDGEEGDDNGDDETGSSGDSWDTPEHHAIVHNTYQSGTIQVTKTVTGTGSDASKAFDFKLTMSKNGTPLTGEHGGLSFDSNGAATFTLTAQTEGGANKKTITDLPLGYSYTLEETGLALDDYTPHWEGATGILTVESPLATATCQNEIKTGSLTIQKTLTGNGASASETFSFDVTLTKTDGTTPQAGTFGGITFGTDGKNSTPIQLTGADGHNTITISGIPYETRYSITEQENSKYTPSWIGATGIVGNTSPTPVATCLNTRKTSGLTIKKVVTGIGSDPSESFSFDVDITYDGQGIASGTYGDVTLTNGHGTFTLTGQPGGDTKNITGIPTGSAYTISEAPSDRYIASWQNQTGTIGDQGATATCTNDLIRGDLKFTKIDDKTNEPIPGVIFVISSDATGERHVTATGNGGVLNTGIPAHSTNTNASDAGTNQSMSKVTNEESISASNGIWFQGKAGETATPDDSKGALPVGTYTVTELRCVANRGYKMVEPFKVTITATGTKDLGNVGNTPPEDPDIPLEHGDTTTIYKDAVPAPNTQVNPGERITYNLMVRNTGTEVCPRVLVRDYIPAGTTYEIAQNNGVFVEHGPTSGHAQGRGYVEWVVDDLAPREERQVSFSVVVTDEVGWFVVNTAYVRKVDKTVEAGNPSNPEPVDESNTTIHPTTPRKAPSFVKVVKSSVPVPGTQVAYNSEIEYSLTVENTGGTIATNIGIYDAIPAGTECSNLPDAYSATLSDDKKSIGWLIPTLEPNTPITLKFTVRVTDHTLAKASGVIRNQASWGDMGETTTPPVSPKENTTNIVEHPLYEAPPEDAETYKWSDPEPETKVQNGSSITYELTTTNTGSATKPYVLVRDYIPEGTEYDAEKPASDGGVYVSAAQSANGRAYVEWLLERVTPNSEVKRTFTVKVTEDWHAYIRNHALSETISAPVVPGDPSNPEPKESSNEVKHPTADGTEEDKFPFVRTIKSSSPKPGTMVKVGKKIEYTLSLFNDSKATAYDVKVFDKIPEGTAYVEGSAKASVNADVKASDEGIGWAIPSIAPKETAQLTFDVTVTSDKISTTSLDGKPVIKNQAHWSYENVAGGEGSPVAPTSADGMDNHTNVVEHPFVPSQDIQTGSQVTAYKDSDPKPNSVVKAGDTITYKLNLRHTGTTPQAATLVRDHIPAGTTCNSDSVSDGGMFVAEQGYVEWVIGEMAPGDERQVSFSVTVRDDAPTYIRNMALYGSADEGTKPGNPSNPEPSLHTNEVWHTSDPNEPTPGVVQVVKSADPVANTKVNVGGTIKYTLHVTNDGGSTVTNQGIYDKLQEGLILVDGSVASDHHGTVVNEGKGVAWVIETLEPGASVDLSFSVTATASIPGDVVQNQATWGARTASDDIPTEPMPNTTNIVEHPLEKKVNPILKKDAITKNAVGYGETVEFLITVKNAGDIPMNDYVLEDIPQAGLTYLSDDKNGTKSDDGKVRWSGLNLGVGDTFSTKVKCRVTARNPGKVTNKAILYEPSGGKIVAIGDAEVIVSGIAQDLIKTGEKLAMAGLACVTVASCASAIAIRRRNGSGKGDIG